MKNLWNWIWKIEPKPISKLTELTKKGINLITAVILCWDELTPAEKENLTLEQCVSVLKKSDNSVKSGVLELIKIKAQTFENCMYVWGEIYSFSHLCTETRIIWNLAQETADTFKKRFKMWNAVSCQRDHTDSDELWVWVKAKILTLDDIRCAWQNIIRSHEPESIMLWDLIKSKSNTFKERQWCYCRVAAEPEHEENHWSKVREYWLWVKEKAETFEEGQWLMKNCDGPIYDAAFKFIKEKAETFEERQYVWEKEQGPKYEHLTAWVGEKAETFVELNWTWEHFRSNCPEKDLIFKKMKAIA